MDTRIIHAALFTPGLNGVWGLPMRYRGEPGTAKTSLIELCARLAGLHIEVVIASLRDPTDFLGLPVPRKDGSVGYAPPAWAVRAAAAGHAVVVFDEANTAAPSVEAAMLRVVLERHVGEFALPPTVRVLAAENSVEDAPGAYDSSAAMANRYGTIADWTGPSVDEWCSHMLQSGTKADITPQRSAAEEEARVMAAWPSAYAKAAGLVTSFLRRRPALLHQKPEAGSTQASTAWPSRRSWKSATHALAGSEIHGLDEAETDRYAGSFVGPVWRELRTWLANMDLPDPADLLDGKAKWKADPDRLDRTMAVVSSCAALVAPKNAERREERASALWDLIRDLQDFTDIIYPAVCALLGQDVRLVRGSKGVFKSANVVLEKLLPILQAAGIAGT